METKNLNKKQGVGTKQPEAKFLYALRKSFSSFFFSKTCLGKKRYEPIQLSFFEAQTRREKFGMSFKAMHLIEDYTLKKSHKLQNQKDLRKIK